MHVERERQTVLYSKHFVTSQKRPYHVTFYLDLDLDLEKTVDTGYTVDHRVQVWLISSHFARFLRATALLVARMCYGNSVCLSVRLSVCLSVRPSVRHTGGSVENG